MSSTITDTHRSVTITAVRDIMVSEIVTEGGVHRRAIRIYGEPVANGQPREIIEIVVESADREAINFDTPAFSY